MARLSPKRVKAQAFASNLRGKQKSGRALKPLDVDPRGRGTRYIPLILDQARGNCEQCSL